MCLLEREEGASFEMGGPATIEGSPQRYHPETDNFESVRIVVGGVEYYSPENYFQCQKSVGVSEEVRHRPSLFSRNVTLKSLA